MFLAIRPSHKLFLIYVAVHISSNLPMVSKIEIPSSKGWRAVIYIQFKFVNGEIKFTT